MHICPIFMGLLGKTYLISLDYEFTLFSEEWNAF